MIDLDLTLVRGRTGVYDIAVTKADGTAEDLSGGALTFTAQVCTTRIAKTSDADGGITIAEGTGGLATLQIEPEDSLGVPITGVWQGPCELTMTLDGEVYELGKGVLTVSPNVED